MALTWKDTESKKTAAKRSIKITNVSINNGELHDEEGSIGERLEELLPANMDAFDLKITFELPDEDEEDQPF